MKSVDELVAHIKSQGHLVHEDLHSAFSKSKDKLHGFLSGLEQEKQETKDAVHLLVQAEFHGRVLTLEEHKQVVEQMKDVLKTVDLVALAVLPGGSLVFIAGKLLKLNQYMIPSAFLKKK